MITLFLGSTCGRGSCDSKAITDAVSDSRRQGKCCSPSWKMVIAPYSFSEVVLTGSAQLGVHQRHKRGSGAAAGSQGFSCLCCHVVLLSLQAEQSLAELTGAQNKLSAETADLRVAVVKMSSINEALALDKVQLSQLVLQVSRVAKDLARSLSLVAAASRAFCLSTVCLTEYGNVPLSVQTKPPTE